MMDPDRTLALAALEACLERYIAACHARVDEFVARHFSLSETLTLQKRSLISDLVCHPINTLWSVPYLMLKKLVEVPVKLGWRAGAEWVALVPTGIKTRYQRDVERLIATELLGWSGVGKEYPPELAAMMAEDPAVQSLADLGPEVAQVMSQLPEMRQVVTAHSSSRALVCDVAATVVTLGLGWLLFGDHSLSLAAIGDHMASKAARDGAASQFFLGSRLGSAFYSFFPPKPTWSQVAWATTKVGLFVTMVSVLVGTLSDPLFKRAGLQQAQLHALIDEVDDKLHRHLRKQIKPAVRHSRRHT